MRKNRNKKQKQDSKIINENQYSRRNMLFKRVGSFLDESKYINNEKECVFWINRIINFIQTEFPKSKKYKYIIERLKKLIRDENELTCYYITAQNYGGRFLLDLLYSYDFDLQNDLNLSLHPKVKAISLKLFKNSHYAQAVFESVKALNNYVKGKANITDKDLSDAMAKAFNEKNPIIKLNDLITQSDIDEQRGFKFLFMGAMTGIRNPIGHENYILD